MHLHDNTPSGELQQEGSAEGLQTCKRDSQNLTLAYREGGTSGWSFTVHGSSLLQPESLVLSIADDWPFVSCMAS